MGCSIVEAPCTDWIALVKRGECSFITKIRTMQESGAIAVIVGDPERSEQVTMYSSGKKWWRDKKKKKKRTHG